MKIKKILVKTKTDNYPILIGTNFINKMNLILKKNQLISNKVLFLVDKNVPNSIFKKMYLNIKSRNKFVIYFKSSERNKSQESVNKITAFLLKNNFNRDDILITLGGGITGDVGGFAASIYKRGIRLVNIPTPLLAQVDSAIGGKTGINSPHGKNMIGTFFQPKLVLIDTNFLKTLSKREITCGYAEILKHSLILNNKFFRYLDKNCKKILNLDKHVLEKSIFESCKIKKSIVERDEKEKGLRKILNYGHTFAHSFEAVKKFGKSLNHGEAVLLGMKCATKMSFEKKILNKKDYNLIVNHFNNNNLIRDLKQFFKKKNISQLLKFMEKDKKNLSNKINLILLKKIGKADINFQFKRNVLKDFFSKNL